MFFKGTDRLCKVVKRSVNPEFEKKVQNRTFGWIHFQNFLFYY